MHIYTYVYTYIDIHIHTYILTFIHTYIYKYIHTYIHTYIYTYIRIYIHTNIPRIQNCAIKTAGCAASHTYTYIPIYSVKYYKSFTQSYYKSSFTYKRGLRWHSGEGAALQIGRSMVRFQMVSLEFFSDIIHPMALWSWGRLNL